MTSITASRRHRAAGYVVVLLGLLLAGIAYAAVTGSRPASASGPTPSQQAQILAGRGIFLQECASCHGVFAQGVPGTGPSLIGAGAAAVDFQISTGRMPGKDIAAEMPNKPTQLTPLQTHQVAAYVASLGGGPPIPSARQVNPAGANPGFGQEIFSGNCAACHNFDGAGGALTYGKFAPALTHSTPTQIYEAMLTGPEAMPVFNDTTITPQQKRDIIAYIVQTRTEPNPGGFSLGRVGPVTEGLVAFLGMLLFMVLAALWITAKQGKAHD